MSTAHLSEYLPYFRRTPDVDGALCAQGPNIDAFAKRWATRRTQQDERLQRQAAGTDPIPLDRTTEYSSSIIESIGTGRICRVNVNGRNTALLTNLPNDCVVEVPCLVDQLGVHPCYVGQLRRQLAALNRTNIHVQALAVKARSNTTVRPSTRLSPSTRWLRPNSPLPKSTTWSIRWLRHCTPGCQNTNKPVIWQTSCLLLRKSSVDKQRLSIGQ